MLTKKGKAVLFAGSIFVFLSVSGFRPTCLASTQQPPLNKATLLQEAFVEVSREVGPSVVSISTVRREKIGAQRYYFGPFRDFPFEDEFFRDFFEIPEREFSQIGLGSGLIIDSRGYILTNEHVVGRADEITVTLTDGRRFTAQLVGEDFRSDLAVIKINANDLSVADLGDSDEVKVGQWAVAIGNPFGFALASAEPTVTVGVISAIHRSLPRTSRRERDYSDLIQTDAAINPGNSGGPLVNLEGEVIGINVAILTTTMGYQGLGFAIPINVAKFVVSRLIEGKKVSYGWLGVSVHDLTEELANYFGLKSTDGAIVVEVLEAGPAMRAGFKDGDIILTFDGKKIHNVRELVSTVSRTEVGKKAVVEVLRNGKRLSLEVIVGERPQYPEEVSAAQTPFRGMQVSSITPELAARFGLEEKEGVVIIDIQPNSPASRAGLQVGDVILEINRVRIKDISDFKSLARRTKGACLVRTDRGFVVLKQE
jgi:serine protease Do